MLGQAFKLGCIWKKTGHLFVSIKPYDSCVSQQFRTYFDGVGDQLCLGEPRAQREPLHPRPPLHLAVEAAGQAHDAPLGGRVAGGLK